MQDFSAGIKIKQNKSKTISIFLLLIFLNFWLQGGPVSTFEYLYVPTPHTDMHFTQKFKMVDAQNDWDNWVPFDHCVAHNLW